MEKPLRRDVDVQQTANMMTAACTSNVGPMIGVADNVAQLSEMLKKLSRFTDGWQYESDPGRRKNDLRTTLQDRCKSHTVQSHLQSHRNIPRNGC